MHSDLGDVRTPESPSNSESSPWFNCQIWVIFLQFLVSSLYWYQSFPTLHEIMTYEAAAKHEMAGSTVQDSSCRNPHMRKLHPSKILYWAKSIVGRYYIDSWCTHHLLTWTWVLSWCNHNIVWLVFMLSLTMTNDGWCRIGWWAHCSGSCPRVFQSHKSLVKLPLCTQL